MPSDTHADHSGEAMGLIVRAQVLKEALTARAAKADELRRVPDETIADFREAGFFRMLQPTRWGGLEVDPTTFFDVQMAVASACPSSAWVLGVVAVHAWQLALFPLQAQEDVWGTDAGTLISSSYAPTGKVARAEGGYRISGRWSFSSGCDHCQWVFLGGFVPPEAEGKPPEMRTFLLPRSDYRIDDNWHVAGLKGTGSKDIVVENAFVPEHRTHKLIDGFKRQSPGNAVNPSPLYRLPFGQIFVRSVSTSAIGAAQGALDAFLDIAAKRVAASDGAKVSEDPTTQTVCARGEPRRRDADRPPAQLRGDDEPRARRQGHRDRSPGALPARLGDGGGQERRGGRPPLHRERRAGHLPREPAPSLLPRRPRGARPLRQQSRQARAQPRWRDARREDDGLLHLGR
jgi:3-hydroxy-9,10-secoandrosta-1,3,5(10)-triene-9,17-dione monooxygenase